MKPFFDGDRPSWPLRLGAAAIWLVMVWDLFDRIGDNVAVSSIVTSIGLVTFVTLAVMLPFTFNMERPLRGSFRRWAWDGVVVGAALFALGGLLARTLG